MAKTLGEQEQERAMALRRKEWKKAHPGFTGDIHGLIERSFDAGFARGVRYGLELRGCCEQGKDAADER